MIDQVRDEQTWRALAAAHACRAEKWTIPHLERRARGDRHPVLDFLFEYYPYSPGKLRTWHPGIGVVLQGDWNPPSGKSAYACTDSGWTVDASTIDHTRLALALRILKGTSSRPAQHSCFGMHEWAMVYRLEPKKVRHEHQPLRLSIDEVSDAVDEVGLRCTHIDAYRFFTDDAVPLNSNTPTRANQPDMEQPGCLHANMDLFKYAMRFQPYIPGDLVLDCFELSVYAREIDMRASPYDISDLGYSPITIETPEGRSEYAREQRAIADRAQPLRSELLQQLRTVQVATTPVPSA